jgi:hypothetical protein
MVRPPFLGRPMPPLPLNDHEMTILRSLAEPIEQHRRPQFLEEVAAELEARRQAGEIGEGAVHRVARTVQRRFFDPPQLPDAMKQARGASAAVHWPSTKQPPREWGMHRRLKSANCVFGFGKKAAHPTQNSVRARAKTIGSLGLQRAFEVNSMAAMGFWFWRNRITRPVTARIDGGGW